MKRIQTILPALIAFLLLLPAGGADQLAVAEPVAKGGVKAGDIDALWGMLESSIRSDEYKLISRSALKQMLTEIGLTTSSDLVSLNSAQKAKLGKVEGVKYILVSELGRFGSRFNFTMRILDASTGEIDQARTANLRVADLDELADKLEPALEKLLSDEKQSNMTAILNPVIRLDQAPSYLPQDFNILLESLLLYNGVPLQNLKSIRPILRKNNLDDLSELEPKMYRKVGQLLEVEFLVQAYVTRFEIVGTPFYVSETGARGVRYTGYLEGSVRVISARRGNIVASIPFADSVDFGPSRSAGADVWTAQDYGKDMIKSVLTQKVMPYLLPALKQSGK